MSAERSALTGTHPQIRPRCTEHQQYMEGRESEEADASHPRRSTLCGDERGHGDRISGPAGPALGRFGRPGPAGSSRDRLLSDRFRPQAGTRAPDRDGRRIAQVRTGVRWLTLPHPAGHLRISDGGRLDASFGLQPPACRSRSPVRSVPRNRVPNCGDPPCPSEPKNTQVGSWFGNRRAHSEPSSPAHPGVAMSEWP